MILDVIEPIIDWSVSVHARTFMVQVVKFGFDVGADVLTGDVFRRRN